MLRICYRKLGRYKYQLMEDYEQDTDIKPPQAVGVPGFIDLAEMVS